MAVPEQTPYIEYAANGVATSFALGFDCESKDHLIVTLDGVEPPVGDWLLTDGVVVFTAAPSNGALVVIQRNTPFSRTTDYQSYNNSFRPPVINNDFDRVWWKIQELGVRDWLLDLKIQKFRDDVNLTALENTLEEAKQIRDDTADSVVEVQSNVAQSQTLLENTTVQANLAQDYASSANSANAAAQQAVINVSTAEADVYSALSAQQIAVNNSLTAIAGGHKAYQTLAAAQAAQASLPANTVVEVTNDPTSANNGTYQWNGTTLTKSAYDPLTQSKAFTKDSTDVFDVSAYTGNYSLTFAAAIAAIPASLKKRFLTIRYNTSEVRTYINPDLVTNWDRERFWIRPTNTVAEGKINHVDERMIYRGFTIGTLANITVDPKNACMIIPIHRTYTDGVENKLNIAAYPVTIIPVTWGFLAASGGTTTGGGTNLAQLSNTTIPANAEYIYINLEVNNPTTGIVTGLGNVEIASKYLRYIPDNSNTATLAEPLSSPDGFNRIDYGVPSAISIDRTKGEARAVTPYFKSGLGTVNGLHISQIVKHVEIQKGHNGLINKLTGLPRRFIITSINKAASGHVNVYISSETEDGVLQPGFNAVALPDPDGYVRIEWVRSQDTDPIKVRVVIDPSQLAIGTIWFNDNGEIHPSIVEKANLVPNVNKGVVITEYVDCGVSRVSSNMALPAAAPLTLTRRMVNGFLYNEAVGDVENDHQMTTLVASKISRASGMAGIYVEALASYANNPKVDLIRDTSSVPFGVGNAAGRGILGQTMDSQWIHPDMCYAPDGVGGFKYWMVNSNFTNGSDRKEDADLLVSDDGVTWKRIRGFYESDNGGLPFKNPEVFWNSDLKNTFMPIPKNGNSFEFALESTTETKTITGWLNHDPAISYHNGYVNVYILYNLGFVNASYDHKYVVCYRTNNGIDWEIVREDGSTMPYNEANAMLIFTKTNGVRNHICFKYSPSGVGGLDLSPQVVKVSDNEWYYYARSGTSNMNLVRYVGTSPYTFDFNNRQEVSKNNAAGGSLWHFGLRYYDGVFYCMTNGFMFTSTDGVNFTTTQYPFFWRGMSSDIYKPTFVVGHDGKVKMAYGIQCLTSVPHPYAQQVAVSPVPLNKLFAAVKITATLVCQYTSLSDIMARSTAPTVDAYVDVIVAIVSQRTKSVQIRLLPCLREYTTLLDSVDISFDDEIYVAAYLNTRNGGSLNFGGVALTLPDAVTN